MNSLVLIEVENEINLKTENLITYKIEEHNFFYKKNLLKSIS